ncbi:amidophosphoribosyltransferase [Colletotrichum spaethianum]|uniref:Amidophosphoribosyltransferase n=1 Tax=Colletotrichum spaethianum TaxID=700344 RepID=A0AA37PD61_9PEZI|nr:amidophosphoribosyltransferase [Colletotrichum spaethianum]GKT50007.1 amidophosphoribosyltransferase [Colletotrichum spaethianum]
MDYMLASESVALKQLGFSNITDVLPGQAVLFKRGSPQSSNRFRRWSLIALTSLNTGVKLADNIIATLGEEAVKDIDVVIPIPETSNTAAAALAERLKKPYSMGFVKNRYVFRTFIMPTQSSRKQGVRRKLSTIDTEFKGKTVLLVDDSIVRGTTSREIVNMAREAGAKKVIFSSCSPAVLNPHVYGIDLATPNELIAHGRSNSEIAEHIGADEVIYQTLEDLAASCAELSPRDPKTQTFEVGVFSGCYVTSIPEGYFERLYEARNSGKKRKAVVASSGPVAQGSADSGPAAKTIKTNGLVARSRSEMQSPPGTGADIGIHNVAADPEN